MTLAPITGTWGQYDEGYFYLTQSYRVARMHGKAPSHGDSLIMAIALHNIGTIFTELGQFEVALDHLNASAKISEQINDREGKAYSFDELGELYRRKNDLGESEKYLLIAMQEARRLKIKFVIPRIQSHLAGLYQDKKDYKKSLLYYDSVIAEHAAINNKFGLAESDLGKGRVMAGSGNFEDALRLYTRGLHTAKEINARNLELACYKEMSLLYEKKNDFSKALSFLKDHNTLRDSIFSGSTLEKLRQNQIRFELENKDTEIAALSQARLRQNSEIKRQELISNILVIVVALTVILLFTVYRSGRRRKRINGLLLEHQEEIKKRSVELETAEPGERQILFNHFT
ncbi:MAG: tetratricopeptide repeat protein [Bacteroidota bacterium]